MHLGGKQVESPSSSDHFIIVPIFLGVYTKIKKKYIRVVSAEHMKNTREKIQFHPQRPNRSKSRNKFSPYLPHRSQEKHVAAARQNREKLTIKQPIIKIRQLMAGNAHKTKLALVSEKPSYEPNLMSATNFSNCNFHSPFQTIENSQFCDLAAKIDQQSQVIEQYFSQLSKKLKLPRIEPYQQKNEKQAQKQKQTQIMILEELKQLRLISSENAHLRQVILNYEKEAQYYSSQMENWQLQSAALLSKISTLQNSIKMMEGERKQQKEIPRILQNDNGSKSSIKLSKEFMKASKESVTKQDEKLISTQNQIKNQAHLIESLRKQIENLKLQNEMLTQEVKLLNYSLNQRDREIDKLKKKRSIINSPIDRRSSPKKSSSVCQPATLFDKTPSELQPKQIESNKEIGKEELEYLDMNNHIRKGKKTKSFIIESSEYRDQLSLKPRRSQLYSSGQRKCSIDEKMLSENFLKILNIYQPPNLKKSSTSESKYKANHEKLNAEIDRRKMTFAKSILKVKGKNNNLQLKSSGKKSRKEFIRFNAEKINDLQIVRKTVGARWRVLRYSFEEIQLQLMQRKTNRISQKEMIEYLEVYPFFLNVELIEEILRYILRDDFEQHEEVKQWPEIEIDVFCNYLREFIPQTTQIEQDQQMAMIQKIRNLVMSKNISLLQQLRFEQIGQGIISESQMRSVLQQFKFSEHEIELMIGQCCLISLDIQHLNYENYFSFFNSSQQC